MNNSMIEYNEGYHTYYVYIITNKYRSTYYIGMTNNLRERLKQHKENMEKGIKTFASKYKIEFLNDRFASCFCHFDKIFLSFRRNVFVIPTQEESHQNKLNL